MNIRIVINLWIGIVAFMLCNSCDNTNGLVNTADPLASISCDSMPVGKDNTTLRIVAIQPNPTGDVDDFRESIVLMNFNKDMRINISNYYIKNSRGDRYDLTAGFTTTCEKKIQIISTLEFLKNSGDSLFLCYGSNDVYQRIGYTTTTEGAYIYIK